MKKLAKISLVVLITTFLNTNSYAQNSEEKFQDVFITAGYATAFGAAFGAAMLSFTQEPQEHLDFVAIGASIGFISGSIFGSYIVFSPGFVDNNTQTPSIANIPSKGLLVQPTFNRQDYSVNGITTGLTLAQF